MKKLLKVRGISIHVEVIGDLKNSTPLVFLHGFTGTLQTWDPIISRIKQQVGVVTIDLTGHGKTSIPLQSERYAMHEQIEDLDAVFQQLQLASFILVGYSMGGRIALGYTIRFPEKVQMLVLESASPGLKTSHEQLLRRQSDEQLAQRIEAEGLQAFVEYWENIPLFQTQRQLSAEQKKVIRKERLTQHPLGLANSLRGIGTGSQPSYWDELERLKLPVLLLTGELDQKFVMISREMNSRLPNSRQIHIPKAGHAIHVEKPTIFATIIDDLVNSLK